MGIPKMDGSESILGNHHVIDENHFCQLPTSIAEVPKSGPEIG